MFVTKGVFFFFSLVSLLVYILKLQEYNKGILSLWGNNNKGNYIFLFHDYILGSSYRLLLGFDLSLVLQHSHTYSSVWKNNAQREHHFWPELYLKLFDTPLGFNRSHKLVHVWVIPLIDKKIYLRKFPNYAKLFRDFYNCINFSHWI